MTVNECRDFCEADPDCEYFTWFEESPDPDSCLLYADCDEYNPNGCTEHEHAECWTGAPNCDICFEKGFCDNGVFINVGNENSAQECLEWCRSEVGCKWFSWDGENNGFCLLTGDCPDMSPVCTNADCIYGQKEC